VTADLRVAVKPADQKRSAGPLVPKNNKDGGTLGCGLSIASTNGSSRAAARRHCDCILSESALECVNGTWPPRIALI